MCPRPRRPFAPKPQHFTDRSSRIAQVEVAGGHRPRRAPAAEVDGRGGGGREDVGVGAVAQAAREALAPAAQRPVGQDRARVLDPASRWKPAWTGLGTDEAASESAREGAIRASAATSAQAVASHAPREVKLTCPLASYHSAEGESPRGVPTKLGGRADPLIIRPASAEDAGAIGAIYDEAAVGSATFAAGRNLASERRAWLAARPERAPVCAACSAARWWGGRRWRPSRTGPGTSAWPSTRCTSHPPCTARARGGRVLRELIEAAPAYGYSKSPWA